MIFHGDFREDLAIEGDRDQRRFQTGVLKQFVVVTFPVPGSAPHRVEGDSWNLNQIEFLDRNIFRFDVPKFGFGFKNLVHSDLEFFHRFQMKQLQFAVDTVRHHDLFATIQCCLQVMSRSDLGSDIDVKHARLGALIFG